MMVEEKHTNQRGQRGQRGQENQRGQRNQENHINKHFIFYLYIKNKIFAPCRDRTYDLVVLPNSFTPSNSHALVPLS